jgi:hypothetical protein
MGYGREPASGMDISQRGTMAQRNRHSFIKFEKELKRKKKAKEKLERRQAKKDKATEDDGTPDADRED